MRGIPMSRPQNFGDRPYLTDEEFEQMKKHAEDGYEIVKGIKALENIGVPDMVRHHHERPLLEDPRPGGRLPHHRCGPVHRQRDRRRRLRGCGDRRSQG